MELLHQPGEIVAQRYRIVNILGQGGNGTTYECDDLHAGKRVALKELSLQRIADWKALELFEREARVLSHLNHPAIPRYLDYFQVDTPNNQGFYLVQELAVGRSLFSLVQEGWHATEADIREIAAQILDVLAYLHAFTPPVIHRDLKPQNILRSDDGQIFLVDFGSVQAKYQHTLTGSTIVGTYGYMAPEQFRGQAFPGSDLYGLGATLLFLLTHRSPGEISPRQMKIEMRSRLNLSAEFADWLAKLLEPVVEDRFTSAKQARAVLKGDAILTSKAKRPARSRVNFTKSNSQMVAEIPPPGWTLWDLGQFVSSLILLIIGYSFASAIRFVFINPLIWIFPLFGTIPLMFGSVGLVKILFKLLGKTKLEISRHSFRLRWSLWGFFYQVQGRTEDIDRIELHTFMRWQDRLAALCKNEAPQPYTSCSLIEGIRTHKIAAWLTKPEKEWLAGEISTFLKKPLHSPSLYSAR
jgi:eukaryotic-like serine/threonine-protein kinase